MALPGALGIPARLPLGNIHFCGKPWMIAVSSTVRHLIVLHRPRDTM